MQYTAINIGPIISTLQMARKPRELWAASYLFSHLMKCIIETLLKNGIEEKDIISPAILNESNENNQNLGVGLYPDRVFFRNNLEKPFDKQSFIKKVFKKFIRSTKFIVKINDKNTIKKLQRDFFKIAIVTLEISVNKEESVEPKAIRELNQALDKVELFNIACEDKDTKNVRELISLRYKSPLFDKAFKYGKFPIETLGEIAAKQLSELETDKNKWKSFVKNIKSDKKEEAEQAYSVFLKDKLKSYHKYICVVQADGDNVGKTIIHEKLQHGNVKVISNALLEFGKKATKEIDKYGGLPIYAGGDDLLFIAPVKGVDGTNIFEFLKKIEDEAFKDVRDAVKACNLTDENNNSIEASLSFGISITYYKYPLYEALEAARDLLFGIAKNVEDKNGNKLKKAWAWSFHKHGDKTFDMAFPRKNNELEKLFLKLLNATTDDELVSAVAHKIYDKDKLSDMVLESRDDTRLQALFDNILEFKDNTYFNTIKEMMPVLYNIVGSDYVTELYSLLRTAKFIKGEELRNE